MATQPAKHTAGPWVLQGVPGIDNPVYVDTRDSSGSVSGTVATIHKSADVWANSFLIAAAPQLLEALDNLERYLRDTPHHNAVEAAAARAAIAKATGAQ